MMSRRPIKIGFMPLVDAASLFIAVDKGFAAVEGLDVELVREVSWSNIRDRLAIGHYDAAHLLAPMAIAATLGLNQARVALVAPFNLAFNGNAITVSRDLHARLLAAADGDIADPSVSARALEKIIHEGERRGAEPLTFGMTFPFSAHNYQLRYWMAQGGVDPDRDLRLVVLPPPFMAENLAKGQVDGFCVGAPWSEVAAEAGVGVILHSASRIFSPTPEKTLAMRERMAKDEPSLVVALINACLKASDFIASPQNDEEVASILARPNRVGVEARILRRILYDRRNASTPGADGDLMLGDRVLGRPFPYQAAWLYAQMARWGQARLSIDALGASKRVFDPCFFDRAEGCAHKTAPRPITAFAGPSFDAGDIPAYVAGFAIGAKPE
ncbi:CmpA/NrtA family ABC transporter substrate-binding protein [Methylocystis sp. IM3]|uniref:CmpA/NrtA family ABC transporter substrate-binding protein n=1 Tax=unclassified Methylocystis TaxID=2625913 RepID=UPI0030F9B914